MQMRRGAQSKVSTSIFRNVAAGKSFPSRFTRSQLCGRANNRKENPRETPRFRRDSCETLCVRLKDRNRRGSTVSRTPFWSSVGMDRGVAEAFSSRMISWNYFFSPWRTFVAICSGASRLRYGEKRVKSYGAGSRKELTSFCSLEFHARSVGIV